MHNNEIYSKYGIDIKHQYDEHKRNPNKKFDGEIKVRKLNMKNIRIKKDRIMKKMKVSREQLKRARPLKFIEPAEFSSARAKLTIWGLPLLTTALLATGFYGDIENYPQYVTASAMGLGGFLFLVSMVRPSTMTFWVIFLLILVIGTPLAIWPPAFLPDDKQTQIVLTSVLFIAMSLFYVFRTAKSSDRD